MKKMIWVLLCCLILAGCSKEGSIAHDDLNLEDLSMQMDAYINDGTWKMDVLQDAWDVDQVAETYGITSDQINESLVRRTLLELSCDEISVFHCKEGKLDEVEQALQTYKTRKLESESLMKSQNEQIKQAEIIKKGNYLFYVCGSDRSNVIQYISSLE